VFASSGLFTGNWLSALSYTMSPRTFGYPESALPCTLIVAPVADDPNRIVNGI